jgi:mono/diheme cytochrome c family protein
MKTAVVLAVVTFGAALAQSQAVTGPYEVVTVTLPAGDAKAGRQAFQDLKCYLCHQKTGDTRFPAPVGASRGPDLDATLRRQSASDVAAAIVAPSHSMSVRTPRALRPTLARESASPMGDFSATLTVRQLADLLSYLGASPDRP